jgi:GTPase
LAAYDPQLIARPFAVVGTKLDIAGQGDRLERLSGYCSRRRFRFFALSAATRQGLGELINFVGRQVESSKTHA